MCLKTNLFLLIFSEIQVHFTLFIRKVESLAIQKIVITTKLFLINKINIFVLKSNKSFIHVNRCNVRFNLFQGRPPGVLIGVQQDITLTEGFQSALEKEPLESYDRN